MDLNNGKMINGPVFSIDSVFLDYYPYQKSFIIKSNEGAFNLYEKFRIYYILSFK